MWWRHEEVSFPLFPSSYQSFDCAISRAAPPCVAVSDDPSGGVSIPLRPSDWLWDPSLTTSCLILSLAASCSRHQAVVDPPPIPSTSREPLPSRPPLPLNLPSPFSSSSSIEPVSPSAFLPSPRLPRHPSPHASSPVSSVAPSSNPSSIFDVPTSSSRSSRHSSSDTIHRPAAIPAQPHTGASSSGAHVSSSSHSSGGGGGGGTSAGMGRKASVSLQLFKETTRSAVANGSSSALPSTDEAGVPLAEGRRHVPASPSKNRTVSGSSYKGKDREAMPPPAALNRTERDRSALERLYSDASTIKYISPLVSPDAVTPGIHAPIPRHYHSSSRPSSRPPSRLGNSSPSHAHSANVTSPTKSSYRDTHPSHPPLHSQTSSSYFSQAHHQHPFPSGLSSSRPASPHLTPSFSQYSPSPSPRTTISTSASVAASPIPELSAAPIAGAVASGVGLGEPALPLPIEWTSSPVDERGEDPFEGSQKGERTLVPNALQQETSSLEKALASLELKDDLPTPSSSIPSSTLSAPTSQSSGPAHALKLLYSPRLSQDRALQQAHVSQLKSPVQSHTNSNFVNDYDLHSLHASDVDDEDEDEEGDDAVVSKRLQQGAGNSVVVSIATSRSHSRAGHRRRDHSTSQRSRTAEDTDDEEEGGGGAGPGEAEEYDSWTGSTSSSEDWSETSSSTEDDDETEDDDWSTSSLGRLSSTRRVGDRRTRGGSLDTLDDDGGEEEEYEVDVGPLQEKLDQNGGGEVSMRREAGREDDWKGHLIGSDGKRSGTIPLEPYRHQVGGHNHIFRFSKKAVCKVGSHFPHSLAMAS